jgi:hypothetical protein
VAGGGLRLQLFAALAIALVAAALTAAAIAYHVFDRELERTLEARLQMLVAETGRVMDAGIAAGLELDRPQLQDRAIRNLRPNLAADEVIAVIGPDGRVVASSNPAEIGETLPLDRLRQPTDEPPAAGPAAADDRIRTVVVRPIQSLFGAPAGYVIARLTPGALDQPRRAFIAKVSLTTAAVVLAGLLVAGFAAAWLPWRARRAAVAIERHLAGLYTRIGTSRPTPTLPRRLPADMATMLEQFSSAVEAREAELRRRAAAVDQLDEAA